MFSEMAIRVENLSKCYQIYSQPHDRLKQAIYPRLHRAMGKPSRCYYSEFWALRDVSFDIRKGETVGIIGRNGSGKSTLLQLICGTLNPTSGHIQTKGRIAALLELGSGFNPEFTGRENVYMNAAVLGLGKDEVDQRFDAIAAFADIGQFMEQPVKTYSSGMVVRLAFAVAINTDPEILVVDEALSVGDELFQRKCFSRIETMKARGTTILFVSHSGGTIVELCDRAILMESGEKLVVGAPKVVVGIYQKLLYAPPEKQVAIRLQIQRMNQHPEDMEDQPKIPAQHTSTTVAGVDEEEMESFDPHLKPHNTIVYESHGPTIENPILRNKDGAPVNGLIRGRKYRYCYTVKFSRTVLNVRFGMLIKTITGLPLGGALSVALREETIPIVERGASISVEFAFDCILNPGVYFMNAGVFGIVDQEEIVLHRLVDASAFRVLPVNANTSTEIIDFGCISLVSFDD